MGISKKRILKRARGRIVYCAECERNGNGMYCNGTCAKPKVRK